MNLDEIDKKCFILALFIRDDGQRFLLGSGAYEFKDSQLHFSANTMSNDVVEVQGNDGYLLAGQVRRPTTQVFDGYIGDASINKPDIEGYRRDFFAFFQKNHFYTVVYIFPDGTAIQRRRGFIVDASEVRELYQMFPEYHIGLNFEDVNYYKYSEDEDGNEQYAKSIDINISKAVSGGLIWDEVSQTQAYNHGTDFSISGTIEDEPVDYIDLYGDTEQQTYSGKNLFDYTKLTTINYGVNNGDGTLTSNQFTNATWSGLTANFTSIPITDEFTVSMEIRLTQGSTGVLNKINDGVTDMTPVLKPNVSTQWQKYAFKKTPSTGYSINRFYVQFQSINGSFEIKNLQIELGSQATSFEPYVGGTASPNPDYPQEVQTVTGRQTVTVAVKNKINIANGTGTRGNNTVVASGQTVTVNTSGGSGTESAWYLNDCSIIQQYAASYSTARDYHLTTAGGTYTVTVYYENMPSSTGTLHCYVYTNKQAKILNRNMVVDNKIVWTVTLEADEYIKSAMIYTAAANVFSNFKTRIQIEKGSTATPYVPYQGQSYEINLGKNLFDKDNVNTISAYIESSGSHGIVNDSASTCIWIPCETNTTYTISRTAGNVFRAVTTSSTPTTGITTSNYVGNDSGASITISTGADGKYIVIEVRNYSSSSSLDDILATIQLERGSTATTYAPYFTPIELCKIGTYQDYIYSVNGDYYLHKEVGKITLDGTETWTWNQYNVANPKFARTTDYTIPAQLAENVRCTHFTPINSNQSIVDSNNAIRLQTNQIDFTYTIATQPPDLAGVISWLKSNRPNVYYPLATATDTQITNAGLIAQLEALNSATTYAGVTWFKTESEYLPADTWAYVQIQAGGGVVWDNYGATWEEGGGGMIVNVNVDSIENVYPVWTVNGPTDTPILTNLTTGTSITYSGNITASQTLVVDMLNQTALLNGTSVIGKLSGDWIELAPGMNRMSYTATNEQTAPKSTLEWQEIVG